MSDQPNEIPPEILSSFNWTFANIRGRVCNALCLARTFDLLPSAAKSRIINKIISDLMEIQYVNGQDFLVEFWKLAEPRLVRAYWLDGKMMPKNVYQVWGSIRRWASERVKVGVPVEIKVATKGVW